MKPNIHTNAPTADLIRSLRKVTVTLNASSNSLLRLADRLTEAGLDQDASQLISLVQGIQDAELKVRRHTRDAGTGRIVKLSKH